VSDPCASVLSMQRIQQRRLKQERRRLEGPDVSHALPDDIGGEESASGPPAATRGDLGCSSAEQRAQMCAAGVRCLELWRPSEADIEEAQMCALVNFGERMPRGAAVLLAMAIHKARHDAGRWISAGECLGRIAQHFVNVWGPLLNKRRPRRPH
jgi:hypothetical protein